MALQLRAVRDHRPSANNQQHVNMKQLNTFLFLATTAWAIPNTMHAQMEYYVASSFGSRFNDINDNGLAVSGGGYFDFPTLTWTDIEAEATSTESINNQGDVAGSMFLDEANFILQPAVRRNGVWQPIGWFPASNPQESSFTTYSISPNGVWVTGQMSIGCCDFGTFLYNTETEVLTEIFSPDYVAVAGYFVTDDGTIGGWADDEPAGGTRRIPVYITPELEIVQVAPDLPEVGVNAVNAINASSVMVGDFDNKPFLYDRNTDSFTTFEIPDGYIAATFTSISDDGIAVGYAQNFGEFGSLIRETLIYHPDLGDQPVFLKDILQQNGVDINAPTGRMGTAIAISPNGQYIAGWDDQAPFSANGWVVYLDDLLLGTGLREREVFTLSVSPNPASDRVRIVSAEQLGTVSVIDLNGQVVMQEAWRTTAGVLDISKLSAGAYTVRATTKEGGYTARIVKD